MKSHLIIAFAATLASGFACAQAGMGGLDVPGERERIRMERQGAQAQYDLQAQKCQEKFAVNDCLRQAQKERREATDHLRRQEISLNERERKLKAAQQLDKIEKRKTSQKSKPEKSEVRVHERKAGQPLSEQDMASGKYAEKQHKAAEHKEKKLNNQQAKKKPAAPSLPMPASR